MGEAHPSSAAFLTEVRHWVDALDFAGISALALSSQGTDDVSWFVGALPVPGASAERGEDANF